MFKNILWPTFPKISILRKRTCQDCWNLTDHLCALVSRTIRRGKESLLRWKLPTQIVSLWHESCCVLTAPLCDCRHFRGRIFTTLPHRKNLPQDESNCVLMASWCDFGQLRKACDFGAYLCPPRSHQLVLLQNKCFVAKQISMQKSYRNSPYNWSLLIILFLPCFLPQLKCFGTWVCGLVFCRLPGQIIWIWHQSCTLTVL